MTKKVWGLTDRRPCGSADREDKRTIKNVWVMGKMTKKIREIVTNRTGTTGTNVGHEKNHLSRQWGTRENNKETTSPMTSVWSGVWTCDRERIDEAMDLSPVGRAGPTLYIRLGPFDG